MRWLAVMGRRAFCAAKRDLSLVIEPRVQGVPAHSAGNYLFAYTCAPCGERQTRSLSKRAYHHGVVVLRCQGCERLHLVADNLGWFGEGTTSAEALAERAGEQPLRLVAGPGLARELRERLPAQLAKDESG